VGESNNNRREGELKEKEKEMRAIRKLPRRLNRRTRE